ncbi:uncharacterized protein CBL_04537 [Carabus blaptoides fortunei]
MHIIYLASTRVKNFCKMDVGTIVIRFVLFLLRLIMVPIIRILSIGRRKQCPVLKDPLLLFSAKQLSEMIRNRQVTSEQVIHVYISRVKEVNVVLNAVVEDRFERAVQEAREADKLIASRTKTVQQLHDELPLLGVPITVKESIAVEGMSNGAGEVDTKHPRATRDAEIVRLCKEAGAIPICVTNTPELCMFWETCNRITGRTVNPYDSRRTPAGSSGGEAALLASGASVIGLGSDLAGSIRLPAMFTGVYGHKPTPGTVSLDGHVPGCGDKNWPFYFTTGPMTRYAEDMPLMLSVLAKPESKSALKLQEPVTLENIKFYYMENISKSIFASKIDPEIINAMRKFVKYLENTRRIPVKEVNLEKMENAFSISIPAVASMEQVESPFYDPKTQKFTIGKQILEYFTCQSNRNLNVILYGIIKKTVSVFMKSNVKHAEVLVQKLRQEFLDLLGDNGVFLFPTSPCPAHYHNEAYHKIVNIEYMTIFNAIGLPVTNCPMGYTRQGLPIGIQLVTSPNNDRLTFAVAQEIEKLFGGWRAPGDIK